MQLEINPELAEVRSALRKFTQEQLEPLALEIDRIGEIPASAWALMREAGYLACNCPRPMVAAVST